MTSTMSSTADVPNAPVDLATTWSERQMVGGAPVVVATPESAALALCRAAVQLAPAGARRGEHIHLASAHTIALAANDAAFDATINGTGWNLPDGKPLMWASWLRRDRPRLHQTRGFEVFTETCDRGREYGVRHYLLGSTPETLERMRRNLEAQFPGIRIVGVDSPPFRVATPEELAERDRTIAASGAHIVWVGLGTPKQDFEAARLAAANPVLAIAVGAAFDFSAGTLRTAPKWMSAVGLEWFFRLISEPRRLWGRYSVIIPQFIAAVFRYGRSRRVTAHRVDPGR